MFTAQELNHKILFEAQVITRGEFGDVIVTWEPVAEVFAKFEPLVGREFMAAAAMNAEQMAKFTVRYRADLNTTMRLTHDGQPWELVSVQNIKGRNRETLIYAKRLN